MSLFGSSNINGTPSNQINIGSDRTNPNEKTQFTLNSSPLQTSNTNSIFQANSQAGNTFSNNSFLTQASSQMSSSPFQQSAPTNSLFTANATLNPSPQQGNIGSVQPNTNSTQLNLLGNNQNQSISNTTQSAGLFGGSPNTSLFAPVKTDGLFSNQATPPTQQNAINTPTQSTNSGFGFGQKSDNQFTGMTNNSATGSSLFASNQFGNIQSANNQSANNQASSIQPTPGSSLFGQPNSLSSPKIDMSTNIQAAPIFGPAAVTSTRPAGQTATTKDTSLGATAFGNLSNSNSLFQNTTLNTANPSAPATKLFEDKFHSSSTQQEAQTNKSLFDGKLNFTSSLGQKTSLGGTEEKTTQLFPNKEGTVLGGADKSNSNQLSSKSAVNDLQKPGLNDKPNNKDTNDSTTDLLHTTPIEILLSSWERRMEETINHFKKQSQSLISTDKQIIEHSTKLQKYCESQEAIKSKLKYLNDILDGLEAEQGSLSSAIESIGNKLGDIKQSEYYGNILALNSYNDHEQRSRNLASPVDAWNGCLAISRQLKDLDSSINDVFERLSKQSNKPDMMVYSSSILRLQAVTLGSITGELDRLEGKLSLFHNNLDS